MKYTVGKWEVETMTTDSITTDKQLSVPDLDYANDYSVSKDAGSEAILINTTGASLMSPESIRYGHSKVSDVYNGSDIPALMRHPIRSGVRTLAEVRTTLSATNTVTGEVFELPLKGWICLQLPTVNLITNEAVSMLLLRTIAAAFNTGSIDATREIEIARGDLAPNCQCKTA